MGVSGEEGTHRSSLGELQPPAPQPTGPCGSHQSSHPSADCIQLKIAPWEEGGEVESRTRAPFPETLLGGEGAHGWEGRMDINTGCEGGGFGESLDSPEPPHQGQLQKEGSSGPPGTSHPGCCSIDSPSRLRLAQSPVLRAALTPGNSRSRRQEGEDL